MIPYGRQDIDAEDLEAVRAVLQSDFLTQGPQVPAFEEALAAACNARYAVASNSATSSLHLACLALGVGPGDTVWTSPITFVASANCALYCGASVDFVDIEPGTFNLSPRALAEKLEWAAREGCLPKVVIAVHMAGQSCDMAAIAELGRTYGFRIIEDASHAVGALYRNGPVGDCRFSDIAVFSFHPVKIITSAEGGMALTNDAALARRMVLLRSHGITRDAGQWEASSPGEWYYEQTALGFNYRMTELQAALGLSQLRRLSTFVDRRNALAEIYDAALADFPLDLPERSIDARSSFHLYIVRLQEGGEAARALVFAKLREAGIGVNVHYIPVYQQPYYRQLGFSPGLCPQAEDYYRRAISIPLYPGLSGADQHTVVDALCNALRK